MPVLLSPERAVSLTDLLAEANVVGIDCELPTLTGEKAPMLRGLGSLSEAGRADISFLSNHKLAEPPADCKAAAVVIAPPVWAEMSGAAARPEFHPVVCSEPYLMYALLAQWFDRHRLKGLPQGIHPSAVIAESARLEEGVTVGPHCVIED